MTKAFSKNQKRVFLLTLLQSWIQCWSTVISRRLFLQILALCFLCTGTLHTTGQVLVDREMESEKEGFSTQYEEDWASLRNSHRKAVKRSGFFGHFYGIKKEPIHLIQNFPTVYRWIPWAFKAHLQHNGLGRPLNS